MSGQEVVLRIHKAISVTASALPGCWSEGVADEETLANIREAIDVYLTALREQYSDAEVREVEVALAYSVCAC